MKRINNILEELNIKPIKYSKNGKVTVIETKDTKYVIKKSNHEVYDYLEYRNFDYYPEIIKKDDYIITNYEEEIEIPNEQKILDLIDLVSLLHNKTTYYESISINDIKEIYENVKGNIIYLKDYYDNLMTGIESVEYMSPKEYCLARNISLIYLSLNVCSNNIDKWYKETKDKSNNRVVVLHNNLSLDHFINNKLISWEKSKIGLPIFDLYKLYKKTYNDYDWLEIYTRYNDSYPLKKEEEDLFKILILLPNKIEFIGNEYQDTLIITKEIIYLNKTNKLIKSIEELPKNKKYGTKE